MMAGLFLGVMPVPNTLMSVSICRGGAHDLKSACLPAIWNTNAPLLSIMVGEGRPSTSFVVLTVTKQQKSKEKRGWSAFADHDEGWE
jgi:hypothetical protein